MSPSNRAKLDLDDVRKVWLFTGEADLRRQSAVDQLVARVVDADFAAFDLERFDGNSAAAERIVAAAMTAPIASERRLVIVDRVDRLSADDQIRIAANIPKLGNQSCLVLLVSEGSSSQRRAKQTPRQEERDEDDAEQRKRRKGLCPELAAAVKDHGSVVSFPKLKSDALRALVSDVVKTHGKKIQHSALEALTRSIGSNPSAIEGEVAKLAAYADDRDTITSDDVDKVVTKSPEDRVFPLIDAVAARRSDEVVRLMNDTFAASAKPDDEAPRILGLLGRHFRLLYQAKFLKMQGFGHFKSVPEELQSVLMQEYNPPSLPYWQQEKLREQANAFALDELRQALKQVLACELATKGIGSGKGSSRLSLEMLLLKLSQRKPKQKA